MNPIPTFARACTRRCTLAFRPKSTTSTLTSRATIIQSQHQSRSLATSTSTTTSNTIDTTPIDVSSTPTSTPTQSTTTTPLKTTSPFLLTGTVTRVGTMTNCVQITRQTQVYDTHLRKHYTRPSRSLVHDPNPSGYLREGDVVEFGLFSETERAARLQRKAEWEARLAKQVEEEKNITAVGSAGTGAGLGGKKMKKRRGGSKIERTRWRGPTMMVRRVVTAFGVGVDQRMEVLAEQLAKAKESEEGSGLRVPAGKKGRVGKQHASAKVAG